jgi:hypothetical protein
MDFKKILPGLILGLLFIVAFAFGLSSLGGSAKAPTTQPNVNTGAAITTSSEPVVTPVEQVIVSLPQPTEVVNPVVDVKPVVEAKPTIKKSENENKGQKSGENEQEDDD